MNSPRFSCTSDESLLGNGTALCLLLATTTSHVSPRFAYLYASLVQLVETHSWARVALNLYSQGADKVVSRARRLHPSIYAFAVPGFKTLFWKRVLTTAAVQPFSHIMCIDDDMRVAPGQFQLVPLLRLQATLGVPLIAPAPIGAGNGMHPATAERLPQLMYESRQKADEHCSVRTEPFVEIKAPLFSRDAWVVVHEHALSKIDDRSHTGPGLDQVWCGLLEHRIFGHVCHMKPMVTNGTCWRQLGGACAYSYITPMRHDNFISLDADFGRNKNDRAARRKALTYDPDRMQRAMMRTRLMTYRWLMPSWRPARTRLTRPEGNAHLSGCWQMSDLWAALVGNGGGNGSSGERLLWQWDREMHERMHAEAIAAIPPRKDNKTVRVWWSGNSAEAQERRFSKSLRQTTRQPTRHTTRQAPLQTCAGLGSVSLVYQASRTPCIAGRSYGCTTSKGRLAVWVKRCRGRFLCASRNTTTQFDLAARPETLDLRPDPRELVQCGYPPGRASYLCPCDGSNEGRFGSRLKGKLRSQVDTGQRRPSNGSSTRTANRIRYAAATAAVRSSNGVPHTHENASCRIPDYGGGCWVGSSARHACRPSVWCPVVTDMAMSGTNGADASRRLPGLGKQAASRGRLMATPQESSQRGHHHALPSVAAATATTMQVTSSSQLPWCMLTPVHGPNFRHLRRRLEETYRLSVGAPPTTVVVFDDAGAEKRYCTSSGGVGCAGGAHETHVARLQLSRLLRPDAYKRAMRLLKSGGWANRKRDRDTFFSARDASEAQAMRERLAKSCPAKFGSQCYQSLKKFYGAADGPEHCTTYWVSDAESYPFRPFNFSALMAWSHRSGKPFKLGASWYPDANGCTLTTDMHGDSSCGTLVAHTGRLLAYPGLDVSGDRNATAAIAAVHARNVQTRFSINNWWMYERTTVRAMIDRAEALLIESNQTGRFVDYFASHQVSDSAFWGYQVEHLITRPGATMVYVNLLTELSYAFPAAFAACCSCAAGATAHPCALSLTSIWGPCFTQHGAPPAALATFAVERLGIFGIFGNEMDSVPDAALVAEPRLSWVVNNAFRWKGKARVRKLLGD